MFLFFEDLVKELRKSFNVRAYNIESQMVITAVELFPSDYDYSPQALRSDAAYVVDYRMLRKYDPHVPLAPLICAVYPDAEPETVFFRERPVAVVTCNGTEELLAALANHLYVYGGKSSSFADTARELLTCDSAEELLEAGFRVLGNPIIVTDRTQRILLHTDPMRVGDPHYRDIIDMRLLPTGHLDAGSFFWSGGDIHKNSMVVSKGQGDLPDVICKALSVGSRIIGYLMVFQYLRDFTEDTSTAVDMLGNLLAVELNRHPERHPRTQERQIELFLRSILDEMIQDPEQVRRQQAALGFDQKAYYCIAQAMVRKRDHIVPLSYEDISRAMAAELQNTVGIVYHNSILLLIRCRDESGFSPERAAKLAPYLEKYSLVMGVSNCFRDIREIRKHTFLARKSIRFGMDLDPEASVYYYKDYSIYYIIEQCLKSDSVDTFCMPEILRLYDYCREIGNDELLNTLRVYLKYGHSKSQTAAELFVHVNTVKYRVSQIENILQMSLDSSENSLKLMLSLKFLEFCGHFDEYEPIRSQ